jgi:hypothetical protein
MGCPQENNSSSTAMCYALTDNSDKLYKVTMSPNGDPLPTPTIVNIAKTFNGEGSAYRASDNKFYAFKPIVMTMDLVTSILLMSIQGLLKR